MNSLEDVQKPVKESSHSQDEALKQLEYFVEQQSKHDNFSGAVVVANKDDVSFQYATGTANRETGVQNSVETKFNLGSINKIFTAVAIAQLVEKGEISFEDPVGKILPDYPDDIVKNNTTIEQLLTHTSGLGSFIDTKYRQQFLEVRNNLKSISDVVELFSERGLPYEHGKYHYSADGYELLGLIIEKVSGKDYYYYIQENIFDRAGMTNTGSYELDPENPRSDIAIGYTNRKPETDEIIKGLKFDNLGLNLLKGTASGSGYSTCGDLVKFAQALLKHKLLSPEMTEAVLKPRIDLGSKGNQHKYQAYGFQVFDIDGTRRIGHPGRFAGVNARFDMYPETDDIVVVLSNYDPPSAFGIAEKYTELITH